MLNRIIVLGRLVRDPELRKTTTGTSCVSFSLAVERDFTDKETGKRETDFIDCVAWKNTADFVGKWFNKGQLAAVSGRLQIRSWTDKDGNKHRVSEIVADQVYFGGNKGDNPSGGQQGGGYAPNVSAGDWNPSAQKAPTAKASDYAMLSDDDDELPF